MRLSAGFAMAVLFFAPVAEAASSRATRTVTAADLTSDEKLLIEDARDDRLDRFDAVTAAIATSSASSDSKERARIHWNEFLRTLDHEGMARPPRDRAQWLLQVIHGQLLGGGYAFFQNDMVTLVDEATFNCVTSAIVYVAAAEHLGLEAHGVLVPSHVYVRVVIEGTDFDIETTSPRGFLLDRDDAAYQKFLADMRLRMQKDFGRKIEEEKFFRREVDEIDLIAMLYSNRGAQAVEQGKQTAAIAAFARAALLAKDDRYARDSRDLLLGQMAEAHILKNELAEARRLFEFAISDPGGDTIITQRFKDNIGYCWALEAKQKVEKKDYEGALAAYGAGEKVSSDPALASDRAATYNRWGLVELESKEYARSVAVFLRARNDFPDDPVFVQNLKAAYYDWMQARVTAKDYSTALSIAHELLARMPGDADAKRAMAVTALRVAEAKATAEEWDAATGMADEAVASDAELANVRETAAMIWTNSGVWSAKKGDTVRAEKAWKRALEIDADASAARTNLERLHRSASAGAAGAGASAGGR